MTLRDPLFKIKIILVGMNRKMITVIRAGCGNDLAERIVLKRLGGVVGCLSTSQQYVKFYCRKT